MNPVNPFPEHSDRAQIWQMLVERDIKAFVQADWAMVADDFLPHEFMGTDAGKQGNPDAWELRYPTLEDYRQEWVRQAQIFKAESWSEDPELALFRITTLRDIDISQDRAIVHKKFFGYLYKSDGTNQATDWQTLYRCRKVDGVWKISGFTGYMPHYLSSTQAAIVAPAGASQHKTAGPYSPVLEVSAKSLVVISGQASIDPDGNVVGASIEEQTKGTLDNCKHQLATAGCSLDDVFKVNVYLKDLDEWPRFNEVYRTYFNHPLPVRTAVGSDLLMTLKVEVEMWASKS